MDGVRETDRSEERQRRENRLKSVAKDSKEKDRHAKKKE